MLANRKVVKSKPGLVWVSWTYRDVTHYGFEDEEGCMLEVFKPTPARKGNALRAYVQKVFEKKEGYMYLGRWPSVAMDADEVMPGNVLVYESKPGHVVFALITCMTQSLIHGVTNEGDESLWLYENLTDRLQARSAQCIALETVPEEFRTFPTKQS